MVKSPNCNCTPREFVLKSLNCHAVFHKVVNLFPSLLVKDEPFQPFHTQSWYYHCLPMNLFTCGIFQCAFEHSTTYPVYCCPSSSIKYLQKSYAWDTTWKLLLECFISIECQTGLGHYHIFSNQGFTECLNFFWKGPDWDGPDSDLDGLIFFLAHFVSSSRHLRSLAVHGAVCRIVVISSI